MTTDDPYVSLVEEGTVFAGVAAVPGNFLVDTFTWCMFRSEHLSRRATYLFSLSVKHIPAWFPGAGFQKIAEKGLQLSHDMRYVPYEASKDKIVRSFLGIQSPIFLTSTAMTNS